MATGIEKQNIAKFRNKEKVSKNLNRTIKEGIGMT